MKKKSFSALLILLVLGIMSFALLACVDGGESENGFTVTFNVNYEGGENYTKKIKYNEAFGQYSEYLGEERNENYWFVGWKQHEAGNDFIQPNTKFFQDCNITLTAVWYDATFYNAFLKSINTDTYAIANHLNEIAVYKDGELTDGYAECWPGGGELWYNSGDVFFTKKLRDSEEYLHISNYNFELGSMYNPISIDDLDALHWLITDENFRNLKENLQQNYVTYIYEKTNNGFYHFNTNYVIENGYITNIKYSTKYHNAEYRLYYENIPNNLIPTRNKTYLPAFSLYFSKVEEAANDALILSVGIGELFRWTTSDHYFPSGYNVRFSDLQKQIFIGYYCADDKDAFPPKYDITTFYFDKNGQNEITQDFYLTASTTIYAKGEIDLSKLESAVVAEIGENNFTAPSATSNKYDTILVVSFTVSESNEYKFVLEVKRKESSCSPLAWSEETIIVNSDGYQLIGKTYSDTGITEFSAQLKTGKTYYLMYYIHCDGEGADVKVTIT